MATGVPNNLASVMETLAERIKSCQGYLNRALAELSVLQNDRSFHLQPANIVSEYFFQRRYLFWMNLKEAACDLKRAVNILLDQILEQWRLEQQNAGNGGKMTLKIEEIADKSLLLSKLILEATEIVSRGRSYLGMVGAEEHNYIQRISSSLSVLRTSLFARTFIVEVQPPQILKTKNKFSCKVRHLANGTLLPARVGVKIISQHDAVAFIKNGGFNSPPSIEKIKNNTCCLEYKNGSSASGEFRGLSFDKFHRPGGRGNQSVLNGKFGLLFEMQVSTGYGTEQMKVWALSLPIVVTVHGVQEADAWGTIFWDNLSAQPNRLPYEVPETVPWPIVASALSKKFESVTGRGLDEDHLNFLARKVFRLRDTFNFSSSMLNKHFFSRDRLPGRSFTFCAWFYAVMKFTNQYLRNYWIKGYIKGFIDMDDTIQLLSSCYSGTFLLRFLDSELGGISIAWVDPLLNVKILQQFTSKELNLACFANWIRFVDPLIYLYPNIPKNKAFEEFYTRNNKDNSEYDIPLVFSIIM